MKKYKMTGCARFFIFLIIFVPAIYFGVSYFNGEDGWQNLKDMIGIESSGSSSSDKNATDQRLMKKDGEIKKLEEKVEELERKLDQKDQEIEYLKQQISN